MYMYKEREITKYVYIYIYMYYKNIYIYIYIYIFLQIRNISQQIRNMLQHPWPRLFLPPCRLDLGTAGCDNLVLYSQSP